MARSILVRASFAAVVALLAPLSACPGEVTSEEGGGGAGTEPVRWGDSACGLCVREACDSQMESCSADPSCAHHLECLLGCPIAEGGDVDPACETACPEPAGAVAEAAQAALETCRATGEGARCEACGRPVVPHPILEQSCAASEAADLCQRCEEGQCCGTQCDPACQAYRSCMSLCATADCRDACALSHPEGVASLGAWLGCSVVLCREHCKNTIIPGPCLECGLEYCPEPFADCFAEPQCFLRFLCGTTCDGSASCYQACDDQFAAGIPLHSAFLLCISQHCVGTACEGGPEQ